MSHLTEGTDEAEHAPEEVEDQHGVCLEEAGVDPARDGVGQDVEVGAEGELGVVLPGLEAVAVEEVVGGLPVVVGLVTVGDT